ncbi:lasso RiPP family leader peptide-containing protein [Nocardioides glacieisoli]|uniref:Lasso RiPP family leader peptide-containing protein n=1 Tax=Nocardioides glacieisoli TaxID=1168730 RepID=A0A4Q2RY86_9ACTN|nr:lasso RiPP family leader peptide-containing protein [Nocardioides glacieisoli]RYB92583.1 lasso RiPP family leader peptide-containing protein [Nocardioides glacieisoli]
MTSYEAPSLTRIGTVTELTQGAVPHRNMDHLSWIPETRPGNPGGGGGGGGGFGS